MNTKNVVSELAPSETAKAAANSFDPADEKQNEMNKVGKSVFYDCIELSPSAEKQDFMKPEQSDTDEESKFYNFAWFMSVHFFSLILCLHSQCEFHIITPILIHCIRIFSVRH